MIQFFNLLTILDMFLRIILEPTYMILSYNKRLSIIVVGWSTFEEKEWLILFTCRQSDKLLTFCGVVFLQTYDEGP